MTRAAELLHVTQPTLSKTLKSLEDELGKKLFTRHSFSIALTEEGALLRNRAEDLVSMADKIEKEFLSLDDITGGELYFGLAYNAAMFVREGLGYQLTFRNLVDVSEESGLVFRPLFPKKETKLYLIWNRYQTFTPIAERFLTQVRSSFCPAG